MLARSCGREVERPEGSMRVEAVSLSALFLVACAHARPETRTTATRRIVLGEPISVDARWTDRCVDVLASLTSDWTTKNEQPPMKKLCDEQTFEIDLECSTTCEFPDGAMRTAFGIGVISAAPQVLGPLTLTATSKRPDTVDVHRVQFEHMVFLPDEIRIQPSSCFADVCADADVDAANPVYRIDVLIDDPPLYEMPIQRRVTTTVLRANGVQVPISPADGQYISLADLFPKSSQGNGVQPGVYEVTFAVGSRMVRWSLVAR